MFAKTSSKLYFPSFGCNFIRQYSMTLKPELEFFKQSMGARNQVGVGLSYTGLPGYIAFLGIGSWAP
jgi:hypothetical protein